MAKKQAEPGAGLVNASGHGTSDLLVVAEAAAGDGEAGDLGATPARVLERDPAGNRQGRWRPAGSGGGGEVPTAAQSSRGSGGHKDPGSFAGGGRARWSCWSGDAPMKKEGDEDEWRHAREDLGRAPWDWAACSSSSSELLSLTRT